jgi:hypothetical protein
MRRYQQVLTVMRRPPATGYLLLRQPVHAAGFPLRAGDLLFRLGKAPLVHRRALVAAAQGRKVPLLALVRQGRLMHVPLPRTPDAFGPGRVLYVQAGAPAPLNPPPTRRATVHLIWNGAARPGAVLADDGQGFCLRFTDSRFRCIGYLACHFKKRAAKVWIVARALRFAGAPHWLGARAAPVTTFRIRGWVFGQRPGIYISRLRLSATHPGGGAKPPRGKRRFPPGALPQVALPLLAEALPRKAGVAFPILLLSPGGRHLHAGYELLTRPEQHKTFGGVLQRVWPVRLMRYGITLGTIYITPRSSVAAITGPTFAAVRINHAVFTTALKQATRHKR